MLYTERQQTGRGAAVKGFVSMSIETVRRPPGRPRCFDAGRALDAALRVFWAKGYEGASLDDLTEATGLARPSLYNAFGNKEALFLACVERYRRTIGAEVAAALGNPCVTAALDGFFAAAARLATGEATPAGCLVTAALPAAADDMPDARMLLADILAESEAALQERLEQGIAAGELPPGFPAAERAGLAVELHLGLTLRARAGEGAERLAAHGRRAAALVVAGA